MVNNNCTRFVVPTLNRLELKMTNEAELTISVPEAGRRYFGLCRGTSYVAAKRGEIPTIRIGRRVRVPVRTLEAMLDSVKPSGASRE